MTKPTQILGLWIGALSLPRPEGAQQSGAYGRLWMVAIAVIAVLAAAIMWRGPPHIMAPWDVFILLDGAWRILQGQIPHTDFHNPIGPLTYQLIALGMVVSGGSIASITFASMIFMAIAALWAGLVSATRLPPWQAIVSTGFIALLALAMRPLGYDPETTSYAMVYNRIGWVLLSVLFLQLFLPPSRSMGKRMLWFDCGSAGVLLSLLFFCKITYFIAAVAGLGLALLLRPDLRRGLPMIALASAATVVSIALPTGISVAAYLADIASAANVQSLSGRLARLVHGLMSSIFPVMALSLIWIGLTLAPLRSGRVALADIARNSIVLAFICVLAFFVGSGNTGERGELPLLVAAGLIFVELTRRTLSADTPPQGADVHNQTAWFAAAVFVACALPIAIRDGASILKAETGQAAAPSGFGSERLRDFMVPTHSQWRTAYWMANELPAKINDGISILRSNSEASDRIGVMALTDPFSFALGRTSPRGAPLWWDLGLSFKENAAPPPDVLFREFDVVMVPRLDPSSKGCCQETVHALIATYAGYLEQNYREAAVTSNWIMYKRMARPIVYMLGIRTLSSGIRIHASKAQR